MRYLIFSFWISILLISITSCQRLVKDHDPAPQPSVSLVASGLTSPLGLEADTQGQLWITEAGSGTTNDGQLTLITPQGTAYPIVTGFTSSMSPEGAVFGLNHLLLQGNTLWLLHGVEGRLYHLDISSIQPGSPPLNAADLAYEDIGSFVKVYSFKDDTDASDVFNLTVGPQGDLFIVDAGANAIIRRQTATGAFSVFAIIPPLVQPNGDTLEAVPTGIVFDGKQFLVSNFSGYPYPTGEAPIFRFDLGGNPSVFQTGLTTVTDIELGTDGQPVVVEYGLWNGQGFDANSGRIVRSTAQTNAPLVSELNFPNSIKRISSTTYYIAQTFDGTIRKIDF